VTSSGPATPSDVTSGSSTASVAGMTDGTAPTTGEDTGAPPACDAREFGPETCPAGTECVLVSDASSSGVCTPTCDLLADDCPEGMKCFVYGSSWQYEHCVALAPEPAGLGEPCSWIGPWEEHVDTCAADMFCWYPQWPDPHDQAPELGIGVCMPECAVFDGTCPEGFLCLLPTMYTDLGVCTPQCDPLQLTCPTGSACQFHGFSEGFDMAGEFICDQTLDAQGYGSSCLGAFECSDGHLCASAASVPGCASDACCTQYCDVQAANACPDAPVQECISLIELWGRNTDPPGPEFADIGICTVP
jgi:hypothetical protein